MASLNRKNGISQMALSANTDWEVRTSGSADNGGGFVVGASGTDYSQQDAAELSLTDGITSGAGSTTLSSIAGGFTSAMVGNLVYIASGTNFTTGFYEITSYTNANQVVLDRSPTPSGAGFVGNVKVGGAQSDLQLVTDNVVAGNVCWIQAGTYDFSSATWSVPTNVGTNAAPLQFIGYSATRGDANTPVAIIDAGGTSNEILRVGSSNAPGNITFKQLGFTDTTATYAVRCYGQCCRFINCRVYEVGYTAFYLPAYGNVLINCEAHNYCQSGSGYGFYASTTGMRIYNCTARLESFVGTTYGFYTRYDSFLQNCIAHGCYRGFYPYASSSTSVVVMTNCVAHSCTNAGWISAASGGSVLLTDCFAIDCVNGIDDIGGTALFSINRFYTHANTTDLDTGGGNITFQFIDNDQAEVRGGSGDPNNNVIDLGEDPFVDAANGDFRIKAGFVLPNGNALHGRSAFGSLPWDGARVADNVSADTAPIQSAQSRRRT